jgi:hypothetical protein
MEEKVVINNWAPSEPNVLSTELGWRESDYLDAESTEPEEVFNFFWKHFNSIIFYYLEDQTFYELFMEGNPFKVWKIKPKEDWDGKWISEKISWDEHEEGDVFFTFDDDSDLWTELKINGKSIGDVLSNSLIAQISI